MKMTTQQMNEYNIGELSRHEFEMVQDGMNAIISSGCADWVRTFHNQDTGFLFSTHPNMMKINALLTYDGHSGSSYAYTLRKCQYYLAGHMNEWEKEKNSYH